VQEAVQAQEDGADFVTLGPVYETPSKTRYGRPVGTEVLRGAAKALSIPVLAIGGITPERVPEVMRNGASGVALISAIMEAKDIRKTTEEFVRKLS
jgi:thiamine-phosphate pyrophosphorylase